MPDPIQPLGLLGMARALGVDPFAVVRLAVVADRLPSQGWIFDPDDLAMLREFGGIEDGFWHHSTLPRDPDPRRARVRALLDRMVGKDLVGENSTRFDNLLRGLPTEERAGLRGSMDVLIRLGWLVVVPAPGGRMVALSPSHLSTIRAAIQGKLPEPVLAGWGRG